MAESDTRIAMLEAKLENALAIDARLEKLESQLGTLQGGSSVRDWLQTLGPYLAGLVVLFVGYSIKDSVELALNRERLDLQYVVEMRDLIKDFDQAQDQQTADADAVGLAMYGKHAIIPLVERLEAGDVASIAAERGLRLIGGNDRESACPAFMAVINDRTRRYTWQTHKTMIKVIGQCGCPEAGRQLQSYRANLVAAKGDPVAMSVFARRYSQADAFDVESVASLGGEIEIALEILAAQASS